ncbi:hypothetical protein ACVWXL_008981 [Bradyrhizobium sp. GM22.5]
MTTQQHARASARAYVQPPSCHDTTDANIVVSEFPLNAHQRFRAEIIMRDGKLAVSLREQVLRTFQQSATGLTADAVADLLGRSILSVRPWVSELHRSGEIRPTD